MQHFSALPEICTLASILTIQVLDYLVIYIDCKLPIHMMLPWLLTLDTDMKHKTTAWMQCYVSSLELLQMSTTAYKF